MLPNFVTISMQYILQVDETHVPFCLLLPTIRGQHDFAFTQEKKKCRNHSFRIAKTNLYFDNKIEILNWFRFTVNFYIAYYLRFL